MLKLDAEGVAEKLMYQPGDHVAVFPSNNPELVASFMAKLHNVPDLNKIYQLQLQQEVVEGKRNSAIIYKWSTRARWYTIV